MLCRPGSAPTAPVIGRALAIVLALATVLPQGLAAQGTAVPPNTPAVQTTGGLADTAALVVGRRRIFVFRSALGALSPEERAAAAARRIEALANAEKAESVTVRSVPEGTLLRVGETPVFTVTLADVDTLRGVTADQAVADARTRLVEVLRSAREERSIAHLLTAIGLAILATLLFIMSLRLLRAFRRIVHARLPVARAHLGDIAIRGFTLLSTERIFLLVRRTVELAIWLTGLFFAYLWLAFVLTRFAYTRPWGEALGSYLTSTVVRLTLAALGGIPGLFTVVIIFVAARGIARLVTAFFDAIEGGSVEVGWIHPETANPTKRIVVALLWLFAVVVAYPYVPGSGSNVFKGVSVFAGLVLSLGSSGVMNQAMSGLVLMYARALKPGDYVQVGDTEGVVLTLGMLSTKISTTKRETITIPNAVIVAARIKNYSRTTDADGVLLHTAVTIGYDTPWRQVEGLLLRAAERTAGLRPEPPPFVLKTALSDFYVEYQLNAVVERPAERIRVLDRLHAQVLDSFNEFGVQITSPHYETDPARPAVVPREQWFAAPARGEDSSATRGTDSSPARGAATAASSPSSPSPSTERGGLP